MMSPDDRASYREPQRIQDYGAIGNLRTVALVGRHGSIDWCCLPRLDSPSVFGAMLDAELAGRFSVNLQTPVLGEQRYIERTNVLETTFQAPVGRLVVTDFMPIAGGITGRVATEPAPAIHRILHAPGGDVEVEVEWSPRLDYARAEMRIERGTAWFLALSDQREERVYLSGLPSDAEEGVELTSDAGGPLLRARFVLAGGSTMALVTSLGEPHLRQGADDSLRCLDETIASWRGWAEREEATGERAWGDQITDLVNRSALTLKLLTQGDTGAFAAAATTSLPETLGGVRNWDYRYCWIRDAGMTGQAFSTLGHTSEMRDFILWAERVSEAELPRRDLKIMYGLHNGIPISEETLDHLSGYRGSSPVRIGNGAADQHQPDIFGELLEAGTLLVQAGYELQPDLKRFLPQVADLAAELWRKPDHGLWEMRREPMHYLYSKLMTWVALDRAIALAGNGHIVGDVQTWRREAAAIRHWIVNEGYNADVGAFVQTPGSRHLDASSLLVPVMGLLPFEDQRVQHTIDRTMEELLSNGLVHRYLMDDGLPGEEGAFVLCTFWLVDALALSGRLDEAERLFEDLTARVNHVGLLSEQIDPRTGDFLGNFPQAFSHIGLITSSAYLALARGLHVPGPTPRGHARPD